MDRVSGQRASVDGPELLALIDRLEALLERSSLTEIEVEAGGTALVLRTPAALAEAQPGAAASGAGGAPPASPAAAAQTAADEQASSSRHHAVLAPLTGIFYTSPSPGAQPYVRAGGDVQVGQVIGLIEAMKLFNEIKSDVAGRIVKIAVESGALVKAKQPLIEVEPA
ncbi:MAG TPA: acetyl-CoA carboxylase biotin carboxyl carrier protein [Candidatus Limnocylindrales bacterium]